MGPLFWRLEMWTPENRTRYSRTGLRYPSDLTDTEWNLIAPLIPPARRGADGATSVCDPCWTASFMCWKPGVSGGIYPRISPHAARVTATSNSGLGMARWSAFIFTCIKARVNWKAETRVRPPPSLIVKASAPRRKGGLCRARRL